MDQHKKQMQTCLTLAEQALANGDPPVGAILTYEGEIIGQGIESGKSTNDITNHAEILAVKDAINNGQQHLLSQSILYSTHEPCIMCSYLIRHHKVPQIVLGLSVDHVGGMSSTLPVLKTLDVPKWGQAPQVVTGVCKEECEDLNRRFIELLKSQNE